MYMQQFIRRHFPNRTPRVSEFRPQAHSTHITQHLLDHGIDARSDPIMVSSLHQPVKNWNVGMFLTGLLRPYTSHPIGF